MSLFGDSNKGHQNLLPLLEDGSVDKALLPVNKAYAADLREDKGGKAWAIADTDNQILSDIEKLGPYFYQIVSNRDANPIRIFGGDTNQVSKDIIDRVAEHVTDDEINYNLNHRRKSYNLKWVGWVAIILAILLCGIIFYKLYNRPPDIKTVTELLNYLGGVIWM